MRRFGLALVVIGLTIGNSHAAGVEQREIGIAGGGGVGGHVMVGVAKDDAGRDLTARVGLHAFDLGLGLRLRGGHSVSEVEEGARIDAAMPARARVDLR